MCAKTDNYYETISWIEELIDSCHTVQEDMNIRLLVNQFSIKLVNDDSISSKTFNSIIDRIYKKLNFNFKMIVQEFEYSQFHELTYF